MGSEWPKVSIGDLAIRMTSGGTPNTKIGEYYDGEIPWLRTQEISFNRIYDTEIKISQAGIDNSSAKIIPENSVIVAMYGATAGKSSINKIPLSTNQACCNIICDPEIADYSFLYYSLFHDFEILASLANGAAQQNLSVGSIRNYKISLPPLPIQRQIASILSAFDDKIELNRQMNRTLEAMARALFKSWFVDFDPVRAKMRGESPEGMDAETAALFPDRLVEVEGREVPEGWEVGTIGDLAEQTKEQVNPADYPETMFAHFSIPAFDSDNRPVLERGADIKSNKFIVLDGAILVSKLNPSTPRIWDTDTVGSAGQSLCSTEFIPLIPRHSAFYPLLLLALKSEAFSKSLSDQASGTSNSHQRVKPADILNAPAILPSKDVSSAFGKLTIPILESMKDGLREFAQLASLRDALLPRLLSGEVDVSGWEGDY